MLDRTVQPPFIQSTSFELIRPIRKSLPNDINVLFIPGGTQDVLKIELVFPAGRWYESVRGSSYFTSHLLSKGTRQKNSFEIAEWFERYGAHLEVIPGFDTVSISLYSLSHNIAQVFPLLIEILQEPSFPEKELEQLKTIYLQNLRVNQEKTAFLASGLFRKTMFGEHHPYGKEIEEKDVNEIKREQLIGHFDTRFKNFAVFVSGKIDSSTENSIIDTFSEWNTDDVAPVSVSAIDFKPQRLHTPKENSVQASLRVGTKSLLRTHPDYVPAVFVSHVLGGYFGSRLMKNIREEKGLTYGIHASIHSLQHDSYLVIGTDVNKENTYEVFDEIRGELKRLRTEPISSDELVTAQNHFIGSLQSEITTPFAHADKLRTIHLFGLPQNYYQQMIEKVLQMTPEEIMRVAENYFHEDNLLEVAVG